MDLVGRTVTIQVGELKARSIEDIIGSPASDVRRVWVLRRQNEWEGTVSLMRPSEISALYQVDCLFEMLDLDPMLNLPSPPILHSVYPILHSL